MPFGRDITPIPGLGPERGTWAAHPNFPAQALLLDSHAYLLDLGRYVVEQLDKVGSEVEGNRRKLRIIARIAELFEDLLWGQDCQQRYEEQRLFPFLEACDLELSCDPFEDEHRQLAQGARQVRRAFAAAVEAATASSSGAVEALRSVARDATQAYVDALHAHLAREEATIIPRLLELSAEDFAALSSFPRCGVDRTRQTIPGH